MCTKLILLYFWDYAILLPAALLCVLPVLDHLKFRKRIFLPVLAAAVLVVSFILSVIRCRLEVDVNIPLLGAVIPSFVMYLLSFDVRKIKLWYIFISAIAVFSFGGLATHYVEAILDYPDEEIVAYAVKWGVSLMFLAAEIIFLKQIRWLLDNEDVNSIWKFAWTVPFLIIVFNFNMIPADYENVKIGRIFYLYVMFKLTLIIFFVIILFLQYTISRAITNKAEAERNAHILGLQAAQYENLKKYMDSSARMRHDFTYMAITARCLAAEGETEKLRQLLSDFGTTIDENRAPDHYCENIALNAITAYYADEARSGNIRLNTRLNVAQNISISDYELCSIVGNILDNAINAASQAENKDSEILFAADTKPNGDLYLAVSNPYSGTIKEKGGKFSSTKAGGHGIGIESVRAIVRKNNGYSNFRYDNKNFYSEIMLRQNEK